VRLNHIDFVRDIRFYIFRQGAVFFSNTAVVFICWLRSELVVLIKISSVARVSLRILIIKRAVLWEQLFSFLEL
jgi:hypothetical protein